ncbi:MAG: hypothetical protein SGI72_14455 [Planctomycetota bacterium]|nr:hypothetical protein [Planctomycetota bacterium]
MVTWSQLLLPIALSAVFIFIASSIIHMVLKWHNADYRKLANEDEVRVAIRKSAPTPGQYVFPHALDGKDCNSPETKKKFEEGPIGVMYIRPNGQVKLGPFLGSWVLYTLVVSALVAYVAQFTLTSGADYTDVFRLVGTTAWLAYAWQSPSDSIWKGKPWISTFRCLVDGLVYALITAGTFGWLWPR